MRSAAATRSIKSCLALALFFFLLAFISADHEAYATLDAFAGTYSGHFEGALSGFWIAVFDAKGFGRFVSWSEADQTVDYGIGNVTSEGRVTFQSYLGMSIKADIDTASGVTGTWTLNGISGTIDGTRQSHEALEAFAGAYTGTYDGAESGTWQINIGPSGLISGRFVASDSKTTYDVQGGAVNAGGSFAMRIADDISVTGDLDGHGTAAGSWYKGVASGQVSGSRQANLATAGSSGSGGCFIVIARSAEGRDGCLGSGGHRLQQ